MAVQCDVIDSMRMNDMEEEMETAASLLQHNVNQLKFSAIKVDLTSLRTSRRRQQVVVVVISSLTSSRDVIKMVVQKIGMDRKQAELMQLVAVVDRKQLQSTIQVELGEGTELFLADVECPLSVFSLHSKHSVSFYLRWKADDVNHNFSSREDRLQQQRAIDAGNLLTQPAVALSHFLHQSNSNGSTLPGHQSTAVSGGQLPVAIRSPSFGHQLHQHQQHLAAEVHGPPCRLTSSHSGFEADPDPPSEMYRLAENVRRWSMSNGGDCLIHYEPQLLDFQSTPCDGIASRAIGDVVAQTGCSTYNGNTGHQSMADRCSESPLVPSSSGAVTTTSNVVMRVKKSDREKLEQNQSADTAVQSRPRRSHQTETPTSDGRKHLQRSDSSNHHQQQLLGASGSSAVAAVMQKSTFRPYSNLAAACSDGEAYDDSPGTSKDPPAGTSASVHGSPSIDTQHRPLVKFSSLPNVERLVESAVDGGGDGLSRCREDFGIGAGVIGARQTATYCSLDKPSTFVSMPCISACGRGGRTPKRFLPSLSIPEEVVEAKRHSLSLKLNEKLQKVARKASTSRQHSKNSAEDNKNGGNRRNSYIRVSSLEDGCVTRRTGRVRGTNQDDDCVSMTSREVAEILSTAAPMAPPSDDEEEDDNNNDHRDSTADDDEGLVDGSSYCDDDCSAGVDQYRLSSALQLLHADDASSTSSSNTVDGGSSSSANRRRHRPAASDGQCSTIFPPAANGAVRPTTNGLCRWNEHAQMTRLNGATVSGPGAGGNDPGSSANGVGLWNGFRVGGGGSGVVERQLSLFSLLQTHELSLVYMERHFNDIESRLIPPFQASPSMLIQVINDVVSFPDSCPDPDGSRRVLKTRLKFTVPMVTGVTKDRRLWSMTSENGFHAGDMLVEVNGVNVLRHSAAAILALALNSSTLHLVLARQRPRADQWICPASAIHHL